MKQPPAGRGQGNRVRDVTRSRLLATAEELFLADGYSATSVDAIAARAGYTTGAVYSNFGGKGDLFVAVLEKTTAEDLDTLRRALAAAVTDEQRLAVLTAAITLDPDRWRARAAVTIEFLSHVRRHPEVRARLLEAQRSADAAVGELVVALCRALGVEPPSSIEELTRDVTALVNGLALRALYDDTFDIAAAVSGAVNSLLTGDRSELRVLRGVQTHAR